jgi:hypothetical protein
VGIAAALSDNREPTTATLLLAFEKCGHEATVAGDYKWLLPFYDGRELIDFLCLVGAGLVGSTEWGEAPELDDQCEFEGDSDESLDAGSDEDDGESSLGDLFPLWPLRYDALLALVEGRNVHDAVGELLSQLESELDADVLKLWTRDELVHGEAGRDLRAEFREDATRWRDSVAEQDDHAEAPTSGEPLLDREAEDFFEFLHSKFRSY